MKQLTLTIAVTSALALMGCDGDNQADYLDELSGSNGNAAVANSRIVWDPAEGVIPLPNDLLFLGTLDGTLAIPGEMGSATDYTDPTLALGAQDGWSTSSPISIDIEVAEGAAELDINSVLAGEGVRLFEVILGGPLTTDPTGACAAQPSLSVCHVGEELVYGQDFALSATGNSIAIVPLRALNPSSSYLYITTEALRDTDGEPILGSSSYEQLLLDLRGFSDDQLTLKYLLEDYLAKLADSHSVDSDSVTYAGVFTTQSVPNVAQTTMQLMADGALNGESPQMAISPLFAPSMTKPVPKGETVAEALGLTAEMGITYALANATDIYTADLTLPYYLTVPTVDNPEVNSRWHALGDSPLAVLQQLDSGALLLEEYSTQASAQGIDPVAALSDPSLLVGSSYRLSSGAAVDETKHLTRFNPVPNPCGSSTLINCMDNEHLVIIPVQITVPNVNKMAMLGVNLAQPMGGWPTVMTLHGLGGNKSTTLPVAASYASAGLATITIDMPLHGERSFDLIGNDGVYELSATDSSLGDKYAQGSPLLFVKIDSGLTNRDNFRQAILDQLALRLSITQQYLASVSTLNQPLLDATKVSLQGLSLGGIVGTSVSALAGSWDEATLGSNPYAFNAVSLVAPSAGLAGTFVGSETFGPILQSSLMAEVAPSCVDANTGGIVSNETCDATYAAIQRDVLPAFALASQTAIDAIDPINYGAMLAAAQTPVHLIEIIGNESVAADLVIPNQVASFPLSGTEPLIRALELGAVSDTTVSADGNTGISGAVRFTQGHHSSLVNPAVPAALDGALSAANALAATVEMQAQVVTFAASEGLMLPIDNGCIILEGECNVAE